MPYYTLWQVGDFIADVFTLDELEDLCFELNEVKYENISGNTLIKKASGLAQHMYERGKLVELLEALDRRRHEKFFAKFGPVANFQLLEAAPAQAESPRQPVRVRPSLPTRSLLVGLALFILASFFVIMNVIGPGKSDGSGETTPSATEVAIASGESTPTPTLAHTIKITRPEEAAEVKREVIVQGELAGELCQECQVYVVVHPLHAQPNYYYWQKDAQLDLSEHSFTVTGVIVGSDTITDNNKQYEIWVLLSPNAPTKPNMTSDEWLVYHKEASDHVTVTRVGL